MKLITCAPLASHGVELVKLQVGRKWGYFESVETHKTSCTSVNTSKNALAEVKVNV